MESADYYRTLGVHQEADVQEIREAYRRLALEYHPDRNKGDPGAAEKMKAVNEAYAVLSNRQKRTEYDMLRSRYGPSASSRFRQTYSEQDIFSGSDIHQIFEEMSRMFGFRDFEEVFREQYGRTYRHFEVRRPGFSANGYVFNLRPEQKSGYRASRQAGNFGRLYKFILKKATGIDLPEKGNDLRDVIYLRPEEARRGGPYPYYHRKKSKKLVVHIPQGVEPGQQIRLAGMGDEGKGGGAPGDLFLKVRFRMPFVQRIKNFFSQLTAR